MARRRASMREGPLAELFRATEAAQKQVEDETPGGPEPAAEERPRLVPVEEPPYSGEPPPPARPRLHTLLEPPARLHRAPRREAA